MKALVVVDGHLVKTPDGKVWSSRIYDYSFFSRYLSCFENIKIAVRIKEVDSNEGFPNLCSGDGIEFFSIDDFHGPKEYFGKFMSIRKKMKSCFLDCDCGIFRIPSVTGFSLMNKFKKTKKPYAVEVVVDPWDFAGPGMLKTPMRPIVRVWWTMQLKKACIEANGVSYVTKEALQKRYPSYIKKYGERIDKFESYYSSVNLDNNSFKKPILKKIPNKIKIIHVSNIIGNYVKGHKELILVAKILHDEKIDFKITFVGDGDYIKTFQKMCVDVGVQDYVQFVGRISNKNDLRNKLLENDIFVFPSHAEGLPRVLIEAMAVGLPCISTKINGIPELLEEQFLVEVGEVNEIVNKIKYIFSDEKKYNNIRNRNYIKSLEYEESVLQKRRTDFYSKLKRISEKNDK